MDWVKDSLQMCNDHLIGKPYASRLRQSNALCGNIGYHIIIVIAEGFFIGVAWMFRPSGPLSQFEDD